MVQNQEDISNLSDDKPKNKTIKGINVGKYRLVGWGVDTTGRRLIDEICQIAAYTNETQFSQYIMPFADLNPLYRRKHSIRVVNTGRFRLLKDLRKNKFVKTKSDITALTDFIVWLEKLCDDNYDGIILVYHEMPKISPGMLLENLRRFNLIERFKNVCKGFVNGFQIAQTKCNKTTKSFTLRVLSKALLNSENDDFSSAVDRAKTAYDIAIHLVQNEIQELDENKEKETNLIEFICPFTYSIEAEEEEIAQFKLLLERQNTFRPVFGAMLKANRSERQHATHLRRLLAENNINYDKLKDTYEHEARDGLNKLLKTEVPNAKENELKELLDILDCFFDPEKKPIQPKPSRNFNNNITNSNYRRYYGGGRNKLSAKQKQAAAYNIDDLSKKLMETDINENTPQKESTTMVVASNEVQVQ